LKGICLREGNVPENFIASAVRAINASYQKSGLGRKKGAVIEVIHSGAGPGLEVDGKLRG
jgi:hypothetical protein